MANFIKSIWTILTSLPPSPPRPLPIYLPTQLCGHPPLFPLFENQLCPIVLPKYSWEWGHPLEHGRPTTHLKKTDIPSPAAIEGQWLLNWRWTTSHFNAGNRAGLSLHRSYAACHNRSEFICATSLLRLEALFYWSLVIHVTSGFYSLYTSYSTMTPEPWEKAVWDRRPIWGWASLHLDQLWVSC